MLTLFPIPPFDIVDDLIRNTTHADVSNEAGDPGHGMAMGLQVPVFTQVAAKDARVTHFKILWQRKIASNACNVFSA